MNKGESDGSGKEREEQISDDTSAGVGDRSSDKLEMSAEDRRNSALNLLFLLAQAYYKILELVVSSASWFCALDLELNESYLWTINNLKNLLANHGDLQDFPGGFEPVLPDLYPSTIRDIEWEDMVAPDVEQFLSTVQKYVRSKGISSPEQSSPAWVFVEMFRPSVEKAIERAATYDERIRNHARKVFGEKSGTNGMKNPITTNVELPKTAGTDDDRRFALMAIQEAMKSAPEDERPHPKVGAVVVKDGRVLSKAHRGERPKSHAEYTALDVKLSDDLIAGATVYTTLEPCTTRQHPKIPCAQRLIDRKVARVVIGMLDPNPDIRGRGDQLLSEAGIEIQLFPRELRAQVEEMNREFIRSQKGRQASAKMPTTDEDQSSWPDVILESQWPSLVHESRIPGSHIVRKRPWMLRHGGPGAVYNVCVHDIDFGEYQARFPFPVRTLTADVT